MNTNVQTTPKQETQASPQLRMVAGLALVLTLGLVAWLITRQIYLLKLPGGIPGKALEYPLWAALVGIMGNLVLKLTHTHEFFRPGIRTELFLKTGLVLMGAGINLSLLAPAAGGASVQAIIMITSVFFFTYWLAGRMGLDDKLRAVMATALSVCGVSAAIAAAGSVLAKKEQVTYVTTIVILVALPLMILAPLAAGAMHLPQSVAGAWFGGNIDTTAAVVGAGTLYGEQAQKIATIVKTTQNALIGVVAFLLAVAYASRQENGQKVRPSVRVIWDRFPKFVLGFVITSVLFSIGWISKDASKTIDALMRWLFTFAFVCMGLELSVSEFKKMGWRPVIVFLTATVVNTLLALLVSWIIFSFLFPLQ